MPLDERVTSDEVTSFGDVLRDLRLAAGLSQEALAERARMSPAGISALERGIRRAPYRETVALLADGLELAEGDRARLETAAARPAKPRRRPSAATRNAPDDGVPHNLPFGMTRLIGRHVQVKEILALIPQAPVVSIVGSGGVGKTRIALQVGTELVQNGEVGGVWFVDLAALSTTSSIERVLLQTLGVEERPNHDPLEAVLAYLQRKALVLILDNCEHVIGAAADVAVRIIRTCPKVRIIATSREPLKVWGERVYRLRPLATPTLAEARRLRAAQAMGYEAIVLFTERAQAVDHLFALTDENVATVGAICRRLEGLPFAIELAAARIATLTLKALLDKLDDRFAILTGGVRRTLPRQQTMRALLDWSYDLLTPQEQCAFEALSVFRGGCTIAMANSVVGGDVAGDDMLDRLASLVDKSLLVVDLEGEEPRYTLPESSLHYAREKLKARHEWNNQARRHALAYLELAEELERASYAGPGAKWTAVTEAELENWRAALEWTLLERGDVKLGSRLAAALRPVWGSVAFVEGRYWVRTAMDLLDRSTPDEIVARLEHAEARIAQRLHESEIAVDAGQRALRRYGPLGDQCAIADLKRIIGHSLLMLERQADGEAILSEALAAAREHGFHWLAGVLVQNIAIARWMVGDLAGARGHHAEADRIFRDVEDDSSAAISAGNLAEAEFHGGNPVKALQIARDGLARYPRHDHIQIYALANMSAYLIALGEFDEARRRAVEALELAREQRHCVALAWAVQHLAAIAALRPREGTERTTTPHARAAHLVGYVNYLTTKLGAPRQFTEQQEYANVLTCLERSLGNETLELLLASGAAMNEDVVIEEALMDSDRCGAETQLYE